MNAHMRHLAIASLGLFAYAGHAQAQFATVGNSTVREIISGTALAGTSASVVEPGDQLGAFFNGELIGSFTFTSTGGPEFSITLNGDNPSTTDTEGPSIGDPVEMRFFDSSTEFTINDIAVETLAGERFNLRFDGFDTSTLPDSDGPSPFPPNFFIPTRSLNVRVSQDTGGTGGGGGGGGDGGAAGAGLDVNGDGVISNKDVSLVIRAIAGSKISASSSAGSDVRDKFITVTQLQSADVNDDGSVNSQDVMAIIRGMRSPATPRTESASDAGA